MDHKDSVLLCAECMCTLCICPGVMPGVMPGPMHRVTWCNGEKSVPLCLSHFCYTLICYMI